MSVLGIFSGKAPGATQPRASDTGKRENRLGLFIWSTVVPRFDVYRLLYHSAASRFAGRIFTFPSEAKTENRYSRLRPAYTDQTPSKCSKRCFNTFLSDSDGWMGLCGRRMAIFENRFFRSQEGGAHEKNDTTSVLSSKATPKHLETSKFSSRTKFGVF